MKRLPLEVRDNLHLLTVNLTSVNGEPVPTVSMLEVEVELAGKRYETELVVTNLSMDGILGMDILQELRYAVDVGHQELKVRGNVMVLISSMELESKTVVMMKNQLINPNCELLLTLQVTGSSRERELWIISYHPYTLLHSESSMNT